MIKISKLNKDLEIVEKDAKDLITINSKKLNEKIIIYDSDIGEEIIANKFNKKYEELFYLVNYLDEDDNDSDTELVLIKIDKLKAYLLDKYKKFLDSDKLKIYLNKLTYLESKLKDKTKHKGR